VVRQVSFCQKEFWNRELNGRISILKSSETKDLKTGDLAKVKNCSQSARHHGSFARLQQADEQPKNNPSPTVIPASSGSIEYEDLQVRLFSLMQHVRFRERASDLLRQAARSAARFVAKAKTWYYYLDLSLPNVRTDLSQSYADSRDIRATLQHGARGILDRWLGFRCC
jgi:hypothetical protein